MSIAPCRRRARRSSRRPGAASPPAERGRILIRIAQALRDRAEELATLESRDNGKPLRAGARPTSQVAARYFEFFAGVADKIMGNTIPLGPGFLDFTVREPIGVSAQIVPWNYPIQIGARGIAPALAAGCTVVLKPAERSADDGDAARRDRASSAACRRASLNVVPGTGIGGRRRAGQPSRHQPAHVHRLGRGRHRRREDGRRQRRPGRDGAGRQVAEHRVRGRGPRSHRRRASPTRSSRTPARPARRARACSSSARRTTRSSSGSSARARAMRVGPGVERSRHGPDHLEEAARDDRSAT